MISASRFSFLIRRMDRMVSRYLLRGRPGFPNTKENSGTIPNCRMRAASSRVCELVMRLFISREHFVGAGFGAEEDHGGSALRRSAHGLV